MTSPPDMPPRQALTLAALLVEFELEAPQIDPPPPGWTSELKAAAATLAAMKDRLDPLPPPPPPRRNGRPGKYDKW